MDAAPAAVLAAVEDLPSYPTWHGMVHRVVPDGGGWLVDLGGRVGPFTRTKRVRLVRGHDDSPGEVSFVRDERDGREHSAWELEAAVNPNVGEGPCTLGFRLHYGGSSPLVAVLEPILRTEVERSAERLRRRLTRS